jgi:hypothetical protein
MIFAAAAIVAAAVIAAAYHVAASIRASRDVARTRALHLLATFAPAIGLAERDPRAILSWHPVAQAARRLFPEEFQQIDAAAGGTFPFGRRELEAAHSQWTAEWLAWEMAHDSAYKLKAAEVEHELAASGGAPIFRARLDAIEREKLDSYQRRYQEYIKVAKALQGLLGA